MSSAQNVTETPFVLGLTGLGGYAAGMTDLVLKVGDRLDPPIRLAAVSDPATAQFAERVAELRGRGVRVVEQLDALLADEAIEGVWLPVPIALHLPFTEQVLAAGKAVLVEKPVAGTVEEVDAMIAARDAARRPVLVGYQHIYDVTTLPLKRRLLAGELGKIRHVTVHGCWPRTMKYFQRNDWAGRLRHHDRWILDSPAQNAMSHFINMALFMAGPREADSAEPVSLEAELYRAAPIENYDTLSARVQLADGVTMLVLLTHAAVENRNPRLVIEAERGRVTWTLEGTEVEGPAGRERIEPPGDMRPRTIEAFARVVRGRPDPDTALATLEVARQHTLLLNGLSEAAAVQDVPREHVRETPQDNTIIHAIPDIEDVVAHCAEQGRMLHESGRLPFTSPPGQRDLAGLSRFAGPRGVAC